MRLPLVLPVLPVSRSPPIRPAGGSMPELSRRQFLSGTIAGAAAVAVPTLALQRAAAASVTGTWKDQVFMTIEVAKYASAEPDGDLDGNNSATSNDIQRFQYSLDDPTNQGIYHGGWLGGDLVGFRSHVPHLKQLGITAVVIYPVMSADPLDFFGFLSSYAILDW